MADPALVNPHLEGASFFWKGSETGVLLVHGFTATSAEVRPFAKFLHAQGMTVAGPVLPGHGTSPHELNQTPWEDWVAAADKTYLRLRKRCKRVIVGGESAGAIISLYLASQHPEIALLLLYSPALKLNLNLLQHLQVRLMAPFFPWIRKGNIDPQKPWQGYPVNPLRGVLQLIELQGVVRERLEGIRQPLLVYQGRHDRTIDLKSGEMILAGVSSRVKELQWAEHSGHVLLVEEELDEVAAYSLAFVRRHLR